MRAMVSFRQLMPLGVKQGCATCPRMRTDVHRHPYLLLTSAPESSGRLGTDDEATHRKYDPCGIGRERFAAPEVRKD
jgi:hypothetical protein